MSEEKAVVYISPQEAAKKIGCSYKTIKRAASRTGVGVAVRSATDGSRRVVAFLESDLPKLREACHETSGNPNWIANRGKGPHSRFPAS